MSKKVFAPLFSHYNEYLGGVGYRNYGCTFSYDDESYVVIDKIFEILKKITPVSDKNHDIIHELWIKIPRGTIEEFGDFEEEKENECYDTYEEFERDWKYMYPTEEMWYCLHALESTDIGYKAIFIDNRHVIEVDSRKEKGYSHDILEYVNAILEAVKECYERMKTNTYMSDVNENLPPQYKTGTIVRKDLWDVFPELRDEFFSEISDMEIKEFEDSVSVQKSKFDYDSISRVETFTAQEFFDLCALGYKANNYRNTDLTSKEQYYKNADGRDDGLGDIDPDSPEEFLDWYSNKRGGGHPWEVCRGGNSTHVSLYVSKDEKGYFLSVAGSNRTIEAVRFYLAVKHAGYPVFMHDAKQLVERFEQTEKIGVVPESVFPRYCGDLYPGEDIISFINLPLENRDKVAAKCVWQPIREVGLKKPE